VLHCLGDILPVFVKQRMPIVWLSRAHDSSTINDVACMTVGPLFLRQVSTTWYCPRSIAGDIAQLMTDGRPQDMAATMILILLFAQPTRKLIIQKG